MILIADAGATSLRWRLLTGTGNVEQAVTGGFNAAVHPPAVLKRALAMAFNQLQVSQVTELHFYGAGITVNHKPSVSQVLGHCLPGTQITVEDDMMGAARALLREKDGIACILGSGSNSCLYRKGVIADQVPSLGYIVGDEGSGSSLGKAVVKAYLRRQMPAHLSQSFSKKYGLTTGELIKQVYQEHQGPSYLAAFSRFVYVNRKDPFMYDLILRELTNFLETRVCVYEDADNLPVCFLGGIAYYYNDILRQAGQAAGLHIDLVAEDAIAGLALFHGENSQIAF